MPDNNNNFENNIENLSMEEIKELYNDIIGLPEDTPRIAWCDLTYKCAGSDMSCICIQ